MVDPQVLSLLVEDLAATFKPEVEKIEKSLATTQNHYGDYLQIISIGANERNQKLIAAALLKAGANFEGVTSAKKILNLF